MGSLSACAACPFEEISPVNGDSSRQDAGKETPRPVLACLESSGRGYRHAKRERRCARAPVLERPLGQGSHI